MGLCTCTADKKSGSYVWLLDRMVILVALTGCLIRLGNLMNSGIIGKVTNLPWGFRFVRNLEFSPVARHPAQLYEAIVCLLLFFLLFWLWHRQQTCTPEGSLSGIFMIVLFSLRFMNEFVKAIVRKIFKHKKG